MVATSVLPSPVFISAILPWWSTMPPISWTSKGRMPEGAHGGLARHGERLVEQLVQGGRAGLLQVLLVDALERLREALPELGGLAAQRVVGERLDRRLERVDALHPRQELLDVALVLRAEDLGEKAVDHI